MYTYVPVPSSNCEGELKKTQALLGGGRYEAWSKRWEIADFNLTAAPLPYKSPLSTTPSSTPLESSAPSPQNYIFPADWVEQGVEGAQNWTSTVSFLHKNPSSPSSCSLPEGRNSSSIFFPPAPLIFLPHCSFPWNLIIPKREELKKNHTAPPAQPNGREKWK